MYIILDYMARRRPILPLICAIIGAEIKKKLRFFFYRI